MLTSISVNERTAVVDVEPRRLLADVLREEFAMTSVHAACEQGACGSCTVLLDDEAVRSCLLFAVQADGRRVTTVEGLDSPPRLHPVQEALAANHAVQCGYCTPGMILTAIDLLRRIPSPTTTQIEEAMSGNICRCTGYVSITDAVLEAARAGPGNGNPGSSAPAARRSDPR
jgi:aerobic carbon-monoxide dehydrogenase small subunit